MLLFPNALCCSLYEHNCVYVVTKIFTKFLPADNFCQLLRVTRKCSCTSVGNTQVQLHFRDDQQRAFGISNISNWLNTYTIITIKQKFQIFTKIARKNCNFLTVSTFYILWQGHIRNLLVHFH